MGLLGLLRRKPFERVGFVLDLSHLHIVATQTGRYETNLLAELLPPLSHKPRVRARVVSMFQKKLVTAIEHLEKLLSEHSFDIVDEPR